MSQSNFTEDNYEYAVIALFQGMGINISMDRT